MGKNVLIELEKGGNYVFHGSGFSIQEFEPRQAYDFVDGKQIPDGEPAIFAAPFADYAIFMALINKVNCPEGCRSGVTLNNKVATYRATKDTLSQLKDTAKGFVYVFNRSDFIEKNPSEWVSYKKVMPVSVVDVTRADFLPEIEIIS